MLNLRSQWFPLKLCGHTQIVACLLFSLHQPPFLHGQLTLCVKCLGLLCESGDVAGIVELPSAVVLASATPDGKFVGVVSGVVAIKTQPMGLI